MDQRGHAYPAVGNVEISASGASQHSGARGERQNQLRYEARGFPLDKQALGSIAVPLADPNRVELVAGYVDSCTYLGLFGVFVAQVTGSFVLAETQFIKSEPGGLAELLAIPFFFAGFAVTMLAHLMRERPRAALAWSLVVEMHVGPTFIVYPMKRKRCSFRFDGRRNSISV
jgi:hypothetical protein